MADDLGQSKRRLGNPISATLTALRDIREQGDYVPPSPPSDRLDGKTCLVTGANSGLGKAIAIALAKRGAHLIVTVRRDLEKTIAAIGQASGQSAIEARKVDLGDLKSVKDLIQGLAREGCKIDRLVLNAGLMAPSSVKTAQGFEQMFAVHYLANQRLITGLVDAGVIVPQAGADCPRIVAISSEAHRSAPTIDMAKFGAFESHGISGAMKQYGHSKLALNLAMQGLADRFIKDCGTPTIGVFHMCPGPINSNIARTAPALLRPLIGLVMSRLFPSPEKAAEPAIYLTASPELEGQTGEYMHLMRFRPPSDTSLDADLAQEVLAYGERVFASLEDDV